MALLKTKVAAGLKNVYIPDDAEVCGTTVEVEFDYLLNTSTNTYATAVASGDIIELMTVPAGIEVTDWTIVTDDVDTGTTFVLSVGVLNAGKTDLAAGATDTWATGLTIGQGGGVARAATAAHYLGGKAASRVIGLKATGAQAGTLVGKKALVTLNLRG
jgi:hypothetical protein